MRPALAVFEAYGARVSAAHRPRRLLRLKNVLLTMIAAGMVLPHASVALADDWGCQVILCLSDPRGPEAEAACVPPIEQLWTALRHGDPFPTCDFNSSISDLPPNLQSVIPQSVLANLGAGTGASNTFASGSYCRPDLLHWGGPEQSELLCSAQGAISVTIDGSLWSRVWWDAPGVGSTITEYYGTPYPGIANSVAYDPAQAAALFTQTSNLNSGGNDGGGANH
jgi:hypothetical protein